MKWDAALKTIPPPKVVASKQTFTDEQKNCFTGYRNIRVYHPGLQNLQLKDVSGDAQILLDHQWRWSKQFGEVKRGECKISIQGLNQQEKNSDAFCKITHLVDPIRWVKGKYTEDKDRYQRKINDPMNQAYVEALTYFCTSKLRESDVSPHFSYFYGSFTAEADSYHFNISEDFDSYKHTKWYWNGIDSNIFQLAVENQEDGGDMEEYNRRPSFLEDDVENDSDDSDDSDDEDDDNDDEELSVEKKETKMDEQMSLHTADNLSFKSGEEEDDDGSESLNLSDYTPEPDIYMNISKFPVMLIYLEKSNGVLDDIIEDREMVGAKPRTDLWEQKWSAWIFQIIAACCVMQHTMSLTHNDLHTNNIVWSDTDEEYLYYSKRDGTTWKVPTYGKVFRIIDFGRAIFRIQNKVVYSDDFCEGNDAATQYNFGPLRDSSEPEVMPNPSFDLCRLAVSMFENLFPEEPEKKKGGKVLSEEPGLRVTETTSELFNVMWSWMVTDFGENVLINGEGEEKYPNFDLYKVIAEDCHQARPCDQVDKKPFSQFKVPKNSVPNQQKVYSLFF